MGITHYAHLNGLLAGESHFDVLDNSIVFRLASFFRIRDNIRFLRRLPAEAVYDLVVIATPPSAHERNLRNARSYSNHFFVEKPLRISHEVLDGFRKEGKHILCGYVLRSNPCIRKLKNFADSNPASSISVLVQSNLGAVAGQDWRFDLSQGGGCLNELGSHVVNLGLGMAKMDAQVINRLEVEEISVDAFSFKSMGRTALCFRGDWNSDVRKTTYNMSIESRNYQLQTDLQSITGIINGESYNWSPREDSLSIGYYMRGVDFALQAQQMLESEYSFQSLLDAELTDKILDKVLAHA